MNNPYGRPPLSGREKFALTVASIGILAVSGAVAAYMLMNRPKPERRRPPESTLIVSVQELSATSQQVTVPVMGSVVPAEEVDLKIEEKDLRIDTYCSSGPGGQGVNTTYSAVRIVHVPTGVIVQCQDSRSQIKNREKAMKVLRSRLYDFEVENQEKERAQERKSQVGSGDRSERIRTYNYPQSRVSDHRINLTLHKLPSIMEGDLDELIDALAAEHQAEQLATLSQEAVLS